MSASNFDVLIAGGGAAGMMAAITAAEAGASVCVLEKNDRPCRKVYITGKGRCNVTNNCPWRECLENTPVNGKFLYSAMQAFPPERVMAFFGQCGCPLKTERGNRVFPKSDRSADVIDALVRRSRELSVRIEHAAVRDLLTDGNRVFGLKADCCDYTAPNTVLALGGASYPLTGSTGDGYELARRAGHTVRPLTGSLVPLVSDSPHLSALSGLTLKNVGVTLTENGKVCFRDFGEAAFTDFGLDGPTILSASAHMGTRTGFSVTLDLKPALDRETLDRRLLRDLKKYANAPMAAALCELLPRKLILPILSESGIPPQTAAHDLSKAQRAALCSVVKALTFSIVSKRPLEEAIVTSGGVDVREVEPGTMRSKLVQGLYFAGEILDVDAYTGGFNLQIAWATGHAAGLAAAEKKEVSV